MTTDERIERIELLVLWLVEQHRSKNMFGKCPNCGKKILDGGTPQACTCWFGKLYSTTPSLDDLKGDNTPIVTEVTN